MPRHGPDVIAAIDEGCERFAIQDGSRIPIEHRELLTAPAEFPIERIECNRMAVPIRAIDIDRELAAVIACGDAVRSR